MQGMELRVTGLGAEPFFVTKPNGEAAGQDLDTLAIMVKKVGANLLFEPADDWLNVKKYENGTMELDSDGNPILFGCIAEVFYNRATFAVSSLYILEATFGLIDFMVYNDMEYRYQSAKPKVSKQCEPSVMYYYY